MTIALFLASQGIRAQVVNEEDYEEENEITVTDSQGEEEVIEFPEAMAFELDSLLNHYMSKNYLTEDNDCRMKDVNPVFEKEVYIERLRRLPSVIELPYNRNSSTAIADVCATPLAICWELQTSICPYLKKHWRPMDCLSN